MDANLAAWLVTEIICDGFVWPGLH